MGVDISNPVSNRGLVPKHKALLRFNNKKTSKPTEKIGKDLNKHFSEENTQMANVISDWGSVKIPFHTY